jgi:hypothetical protein
MARALPASAAASVRGAARSSRIFRAKSAGSSGSAYAAASPQTSRRTGISEQTVGIPACSASRGGIPKPSILDGNTNAFACA